MIKLPGIFADMKYRKLGATGFDVSVVGFGVWQIGGGRWQAASQEKSVKLLRDAHALGVNIFDSAVVYGQYKDEGGYLQSRAQELLGEAFKDKRDEVIYCVKLGQFDEYAHRSNFEPGRIVDQFKQSLRRLRTEYIDIALVHAPSIKVVEEGKAIAIFQTLRALGLVKAIGYSFENEPEHVQAALKQDIDVIMLQYNLIDTDCAKVIKEAEERGVGILVGGPFKRGYLTGRFAKMEDLPLADDYWKWNVGHNPGKVRQILKQVEVLREKYKSPKGLRRAAIEHIVKESGTSSLVIGQRDIREVRENIESLEEGLRSLRPKVSPQRPKKKL